MLRTAYADGTLYLLDGQQAMSPLECCRIGATCDVPTPCPDCGQAIELCPSGWWSHVGMPDGCWRVSMDGPNDA